MADKISIQNGVLQVPDNSIMPYIECDGTGPDIRKAAVRVMDLILKGLNGAIGGKIATCDFAHLMRGAKEVKYLQFSDAVIA